MSTREIPKHEWAEFFRDFSRFHQGWIMTVDVFNGAMGAQKIADELAFGGIVAETRPDGRIVIEVMAGETTAHHITHTLTAPASVEFKSESEGEVLQIRDEGDTTVLISCHRSGVPAKLPQAALQKS